MTQELSFVDWIVEQLRVRKMTQKDLTDRSGLGKSVVSKLVRNMLKKPDLRTYIAIAKAFEVSPITVFRIAEILPPDLEFPELEDFKTLLASLSPQQRALALELVKTVQRCGTEQNSARGEN